MFSKDFLWGAAISAFQAEGAIEEDGRGLSVADIRLAKSAQLYQLADNTVAVDFYHRYEQDIALMKQCGLKSFRFSISWSRILPEGRGKVNQKGIEFYRHLIQTLHDNGIEPIVTLYHFDLPQALVDAYGGFASRQCIDDFVNYAKIVFLAFGDLVHYWLTINEQMVITHLPAFQGLNDLKTSYQAFHHMCLAHAKVTKLYHEMGLKGKIGPCISYTTHLPASVNSKDVMLAYEQDDLHVFSLIDTHVYGAYPEYFLNHLKKEKLMFEIKDGDDQILKTAQNDFIGINWYVTEIIGRYIGKEMHGQYEGEGLPRQNRSVPGKYQYYRNPYTLYSEYNWNMDPVGLRFALRRMYARYHLPIMITENGWAANEGIGLDGKIHDEMRIQYLKGMIEQMGQAIEDGVALIGYQPWSFIDVLSSSQGMDKRYGLVYVDRSNDDLKSLKRIPKDSYYFYQKVISLNGKIDEKA